MTTTAFNGKARNYDAARPGYPAGAIDCILQQLPRNPAVADVGAGTGKLSVLLAERGIRLFAVEPNEDMRENLIKNLAPYGSAAVSGGTAENTAIAAVSVDAVVCAQAFHWFDSETFKRECHRILKPNGKVFIVYNTLVDRQSRLTELDWHDISRAPSHRFQERHDAVLSFFQGRARYAEFPNPIMFDSETYLAFMLSHSHSPNPGDAEYEHYVESVKTGFIRISTDGVYIENRATRVYYGQCPDAPPGV